MKTEPKLRNRDGLTDEQFEEARWKSVVMLNRQKKKGFGSPIFFWNDMVTFCDSRTLGRAQYEAIVNSHKNRDNK